MTVYFYCVKHNLTIDDCFIIVDSVGNDIYCIYFELLLKNKIKIGVTRDNEYQ